MKIICILSMITIVSFAIGDPTHIECFDQNKFKIAFTCFESWACAAVTGPYELGEATITITHPNGTVEGRYYRSEYDESTCCQLSQHISDQICREDIEALGTVVSCR